jgi:hypothetical protein
VLDYFAPGDVDDAEAGARVCPPPAECCGGESGNDLDHVDRYATAVDGSTVASRVEDWSLPTYTRDARPSNDFWLPRSVTLPRTATEVLRELDNYPEANTYYLVRIYLPRALQQDPTFGGRLHDLARALAEIDPTDTRIRPHLHALLDSIPDTKRTR